MTSTDDETLPNFIKRNHPRKGENGLHSMNLGKSSWDYAHSKCKEIIKKNFRCACLREHVL
jgi:hypothetical protein